MGEGNQTSKIYTHGEKETEGEGGNERRRGWKGRKKAMRERGNDE
jgi:hypothetical protein